MMENLAKLIKVKSIVTFCVLAVWTILAVRGTIDGQAVNNTALMLFAFYFGTQSEKRSGNGA